MAIRPWVQWMVRGDSVLADGLRNMHIGLYFSV